MAVFGWLAALAITAHAQDNMGAGFTDTAQVIGEFEQLRTELLKLRDEIEPFTARQSFVYLNLDDDIPAQRATLTLTPSDDQQSPTTLSFTETRDDGLLPELSRLPVAYGLLQQEFAQLGGCELTYEITTEEGLRQVTLPCSPPDEAHEGSSVEVVVRKRWLRSASAGTRTWPSLDTLFPSDPKRPGSFAAVKEFGSAVSGLAKALDKAVGPREQGDVRELTGSVGGLPPDLRFELSRCNGSDGEAVMSRLFRYRSTYQANLPPDFWLGYGRCALENGYISEAEHAHHLLVNLAPSTESELELAWRIGDAYYEIGDIETALEWLARDIDDIPADLQTMWRDLKSRIFLIRGQPELALPLLSKGRHLSVAGTTLELYRNESLHHAMRMNYAVALFRMGQTDEAMSVLQRVGTSPAPNPVAINLRARANAKLGWHFLSEGYGGSAVKALFRIPLDSVYADRALLGMGWAMMAPRGEAQPLVPPPGFDQSQSDPPATSVRSLLRLGEVHCNQYLQVTGSMDCSAEEKFSRAEFSEDETQQLKRALVYWHELIVRNGRGNATLEAMLAVAEAHYKLGDLAVSQKMYSQASTLANENINRLQAFVSQLETASEKEEVDAAVRLLRQIGQVPEELEDWLASNQGRSLLAAVDQIQRVELQIEWMLDSPLVRTPYAPRIGQLKNRIPALQEALARRYIGTARQALDDHIKDYERYATHAGLGVAQLSTARAE